jgi:tetratricopeptide (TPR) repeat protein
VLRELLSIQAMENAILATDDNNVLLRAKSSLAAGDREAALKYWTEARRQHPEFVKTSNDTLNILIGLQFLDEAEELMSEGRKRFPRDLYYARGYAQVAAERRDYVEAARRWDVVRKKFPNSWEGYALGAASLKELGQLDEAEALLERAIKLFGKEAHCQLEYSRIAEIRKNWPEALRRWTQVEEQLGHTAGIVGVGRALREMGRLDEAEAKLTFAAFHRPEVYEIVLELARLAQKRGNETAELEHWQTLVRRFPMVQHAYHEYARRLTAMKRNDELDALLLRAVGRFPRDIRPAIQYAAAAHDRQDWLEAERRWRTLRETWPNCPDGYRRGADVLGALKREDEAALLREEHKRRFGL